MADAVDALVLAGSYNDGPLRECSPARYEALIPIGSRPMAGYVVEALLKASRIGRIVVVGPKELAGWLDPERVQLVEPGGSLIENALQGLRHLPGARRVLMATGDIPLLTAQAVDDFLELCRDQSADIYYPVVPREVLGAVLSSSARTFVNLREGVFTGGNLLLINPKVVEACLRVGQRLIDARKSPLKLCRLVGFLFLVRFLLRGISLKEAQEKVSRMLGVRGQVVICRYPEVGVDVDKPSDLEMVSRLLTTA